MSEQITQELFNHAAALRLLAESEEISEGLKAQIMRLCAAAAEDMDNAKDAPKVKTLFPLNDKEINALSISSAKNSVALEPLERSALGNIPKRGDIIRFGGHEWIVLHFSDSNGDCMVLSKNVLFECPLSDWQESGWNKSLIRKWLNSGFYSSLGDDGRISKVITEQSPGSIDKIFLLNKHEIEKLLLREERVSDGCWWLRSVGNSALLIVDKDGRIIENISPNVTAGIRPAMILRISDDAARLEIIRTDTESISLNNNQKSVEKLEKL